MLCLRETQLDLFDDVLPAEAVRLSAELLQIDRYLDDPRFFEPFLKRGQRKRGRPTIPMERFIRLMYLKVRYDLSYERLVEFVGDSFKWKRFCRIPLFESVPHSTTLIKLVNRFGPETVEELNRLLVQKLQEDELIQARRMRTDTTVTEANIEYPTDADLLEDGVRLVTRTVKQFEKLSSNVAAGFRDRTRKMKKCLIGIGHWLKRRNEESKDKVNEITAEAAQAAGKMLGEAETILKRARGFIGGCGEKLKSRARKLYDNLTHWVGLTHRALDQTKLRLKGETTIPDRMVSLFDPEARCIRRGVPGKPVEFGYKVRLDEVEGGIVSGYAVHTGNPSDTTQAIPAVEKHIETFGKAPREVATDRGFQSTANEKALEELGVKRVSMPVRGKRSAKRTQHEHQRWFRELQRWRAPAEATISLLTRCYGMRRSLARGHDRTTTWVGLSILGNNLKRIPELVGAKANREAERAKKKAARAPDGS